MALVHGRYGLYFTSVFSTTADYIGLEGNMSISELTDTVFADIATQMD